ncbi:uncharacterized protein PgNI_03316 [Pyricularia grisea]|uniref:Uncharacterized protein n=1 Tax=Pyricularia grisea TaxID=148305 RepID=A0A6P8BA10_PYRGI|nr:uncharacterized protein PgNI_03316 [Pyricularia grisea]TLD12512.1 hypothetical protein PgNI_03316 [Pyricularia grisea]
MDSIHDSSFNRSSGTPGWQRGWSSCKYAIYHKPSKQSLRAGTKSWFAIVPTKW